MAITKGAKKAIRSSERKQAFNTRRKRKIKNVVKEIQKLISENKIKEAEEKLKEAYKTLDKAAKMNTIKKNNASRKKSRLAAQIKKAKNK
jgi:small subunit ribosomal protein S20